MRNAGAAILFMLVLCLANQMVARSWDGRVFVYMGERRAPASVRHPEDYSAVKASALTDPIQNQVMASATLDVRQDMVGIRLGHPLVPAGGDGTRGFACAVPGHEGQYDRVRVTLYGTGVTDSGNEPHLDIETDCRSSTSLDTLDEIWIPMAEIMRQSTDDGEEVIPGEGGTVIRRSNIPNTWPTSWSLVSLQFYREGAVDPGLTLQAADLLAGGVGLLSFDFKPGSQAK